MKIYLVGGAVRDKLRNVVPDDNDYVVVGSDPEEMQHLGFRPIGKDFPVFLHPQTKEEYALARKEIKIGRKHTDFAFIFNPNITLREDLERRDFTCNAIAYDPKEDVYIDYFNGQKDISDKIIRHINSAHFAEDPLRILRMCRFAAKLDFSVADETFQLCRNMVEDNLLSSLSAERIWAEFVKAMKTPRFHLFISLLGKLGAIQKIFPDIEIKLGRESNMIDIFKNAENQEPLIKFALMCVVLNPSEILKICQALKVSNKYRYFAMKAATLAPQFEQISSQNPQLLLELVDKLTIGHISYVQPFLAFCRATAHMSDASQNDFADKTHLLFLAQDVLSSVKAQDMPTFYNLPKNKEFGKIFQNYKLGLLKERLHDHMEKLSPR